MSKLSEMAGVELINLYARKEPTQDKVSICHGLGKKMDTVLIAALLLPDGPGITQAAHVKGRRR